MYLHVNLREGAKISVTDKKAMIVFAQLSLWWVAPLARGQQVTVPDPSSPEEHVWSRYLRDFRGGNNFTLSIGFSSGTWSIQHLNAHAATATSSKAVVSNLQYSFHLPLRANFGYIVGSSASSTLASSGNGPMDWQPPGVLDFPGLVGGLLFNASPEFRILGWGDVHLTRLSQLEVPAEDSGEKDSIHATVQSFEGAVAADFFFKLSWALRVEGGIRKSLFLQPAAAQDLPIGARFYYSGRWVALGICYNYL